MSAKIRLVERATDPHQHPTLSRRWLVFLSLVLLILGLVGWFFLSTRTELDVVKRFFRYGSADDAYGTLSLEPRGVSHFTLIDNCLAHGTQGSVTVYSQEGSPMGALEGNFVSPSVASRNGRLLVYDIGGKEAALLNSSGEPLFRLEAESIIYDGDLADNGSVCLLREGADSRAVLDLYSRRGTLLFRRISKSNYLNACAVSPDGSYVVAATLGQEAISFSSTAQIFDVSGGEAFAELDLGAQLIYDMDFLDRKTVCALGENSLLFFSVDGTLLGEYASQRGTPISYSFDGDGFVTVLFDLFEIGSRYALVTLDKNGTVIATVAVEDAPLNISACGRYVAVLTEKELRIYNSDLYLQNTTANLGCLTAYVRSDGTAYCVGSDFAKLYIP